jgi:RNA polymerase sigma-70 factor
VRKTAEVLVEDDQLLGLADPKMPALDVAVEEYRAAFKVAFKVALASLSALEKTALKQHYLDRLTLDEMAALHATHRTTVARWLRQAREAVFQRTREKMMESTRASSSACDSILRGVRSQLDVTMQSLFE